MLQHCSKRTISKYVGFRKNLTQLQMRPVQTNQSIQVQNCTSSRPIVPLMLPTDEISTTTLLKYLELINLNLKMYHVRRIITNCETLNVTQSRIKTCSPHFIIYE